METDPIVDSPAELQKGVEPTSGTLLREERLRQGRSEKEVADLLHLTMHYVRSIESDNYEKLPGAVFARGYIRSYALLLGLDPEMLVSRYGKLTEEKPPISVATTRKTMVRQNRSGWLPWLGYCVIAFAVGFVSLWAYLGVLASDRTQTAGAAAQPIAAIPAATPEADTLNAIIEAESSVAAELLTSSFSGDSQTPVEIETTELSIGNPDSEYDSHIIEIVNAGDDLLELSFSGESWVEIKDSGTATLYRDLREAGDVVRITGEAPFNILLGDAPFAKLQLNGVDIDLTESIRIDNSARMTVGI
jgi:cytoskeleton protein RodZ